MLASSQSGASSGPLPVRHGQNEDGAYVCFLGAEDGVRSIMRLESWYRDGAGELTGITHVCDSCSRHGYLICESPELAAAIKEIERREKAALGRIAEGQGGV